MVRVNGQFSRDFGATSLLNCTENLEEENNPIHSTKLEKIQWRCPPPNCRFLSPVVAQRVQQQMIIEIIPCSSYSERTLWSGYPCERGTFARNSSSQMFLFVSAFNKKHVCLFLPTMITLLSLPSKLLLTPSGDPRRTPEKQTVGSVTASQKMPALQALSSSLNAGAAKGGCLAEERLLGCPPAVCPPEPPRPFTHYRIYPGKSYCPHRNDYNLNSWQIEKCNCKCSLCKMNSSWNSEM